VIVYNHCVSTCGGREVWTTQLARLRSLHRTSPSTQIIAALIELGISNQGSQMLSITIGITSCPE
jgi:hypothetical protein